MFGLQYTDSRTSSPSKPNHDYFAGNGLVERSVAPGLVIEQRDALRREAIAAYDKGLAARPDHPLAHVRRARQLIRLGELVQADTSLRRCVEAIPQPQACIVELAQMYIEQGHVELGAKILEQHASSRVLERARAMLLTNQPKSAEALLKDVGLPGLEQTFLWGQRCDRYPRVIQR